MRNIAVVGTGYVGLVTGVCLSDIGHHVTCIDIDEQKIQLLKQGKSPIYEPGLEELMLKNINNGRLTFTTDHQTGFHQKEVIYIAVGTPQKKDGSADLSYVHQVARDIARNIKQDVIVVTKSTVPVGTNDEIRQVIKENLVSDVQVDVVSNPEFLREGSAVQDTFHGDRIVIGADNEKAATMIEEINKPFGIPVVKTDIRSAEMIKYASNAFLATKISFINEISNICEKLGANIEDVAYGMGLDHRIGNQFLRAGIGYGGSCFPKDTKALVQMAGNVDHKFELLESVIRVNNVQQAKLVEKAKGFFGSLEGKTVAILGLAFKPNTDDMREAASVVIANMLIQEGARIKGYDPIALENAKRILGDSIEYSDNIEDVLADADIAFISTEWKEIVEFELHLYSKYMKTPIVFDGRNCYALEEVEKHDLEYHSIGRPSVYRSKAKV
ncbi:UDP-glucose dehydrogenase family protein [Melghiribacillus thermohalophilus]|nr:UDP-glucose/GDP-mannose dehydrogenase family protein [Melghiribacillus thermohalophilus]